MSVVARGSRSTRRALSRRPVRPAPPAVPPSTEGHPLESQFGTQFLQTVEEVLSLLEAELPASPVDPGNARLESRLESELRRYFLALEKALPADELARLYYSQVEQ